MERLRQREHRGSRRYSLVRLPTGMGFERKFPVSPPLIVMRTRGL